MADVYYLPLGFVVGMIGTIIGAGGGFLLSPFFLFLFPTASASWITAMSLAAVAANSTSGSLGYIYRKNVHWPSVILFSLCSIPGVLIGVYLTKILDRSLYNTIFGISLVAMAISLHWKSQSLTSQKMNLIWTKKTKLVGGGISAFVGVLSSLLGIGGGIVHVPLLHQVLLYPIHLAAGTSHTILAVTSIVAVTDHWISGDYSPAPSFLLPLCGGLILGAQFGSSIAPKIPAATIRKILILALLLVGIRLTVSGLNLGSLLAAKL